MRLGFLASSSAAMLVTADSQASTSARAAIDVGNIFAQGGAFGLILYALVLAVFLQFLVVVTLLMVMSRWNTAARLEREKLNDNCHAQAVEFAAASRLAAEALKDAATAIASSASADMTFKQGIAGMIERLELALTRFEAGKRR